MPIYEYEAEDGCDICGGHFELLQDVGEPTLTQCPLCEKPCRRVLSAFITRQGRKANLNRSNIEKHGFTRYERAGDGTYQRTAGEGPDTIRKDTQD